MDETIVIREARKSDLPALLELYQHLHADDEQASLSELERAWSEICDAPTVHCLVAEQAGILVSSCILAIISNLTRGARPYAVIENVVTHADFRRKGWATAVLEHALDLAWRRNCYKVMLLSGVGREGAHHLYERVGFRRDRKVGFVVYADAAPRFPP